MFESVNLPMVTDFISSTILFLIGVAMVLLIITFISIMYVLSKKVIYTVFNYSKHNDFFDDVAGPTLIVLGLTIIFLSSSVTTIQTIKAGNSPNKVELCSKAKS